MFFLTSVHLACVCGEIAVAMATSFHEKARQKVFSEPFARGLLVWRVSGLWHMRLARACLVFLFYFSSILCPKGFFGVASSDSLRWIRSCLTGFLCSLPISFPSSLRKLLPWVSRSLCLFSFHRGGHFDKTKRYSNICQRNLRNLVSIERSKTQYNMVCMVFVLLTV